MLDIIFNSFSNLFSHINIVLGYFLIFLFSFLEFFILSGWLIPGSLILIIWWIFASLWFFNVYFLILVAFIWSFVWSYVSYKYGLKVWKRVLNNWFLFFPSSFFQKTKKIYKHYHTYSLIFGKLVPWIKETISFIAGVFHIKKCKFLLLNAINSFLWAFFSVLIGYVFSFSFDIAVRWLSRIASVIIFLFFLLLIFSVIRYYIFSFWKWFIELLKLFIKFILPWKVYPKLVSLNKSKIYTLMWLFFVFYLILAFIWVLKYSYQNSVWTYLDNSVSNLLYYFYDKRLVYLFLIISFFWKVSTIFLFSLIFSYFILRKKERNYLFSLWIWVFAWTIIVFLTKIIVWRHRPDLALYVEFWNSFPSFHSTISVIFYWFLFYYLIRKEKNYHNKTNIFLTFLFVIFLISFSRLYLQVHYLSDVIAWIILGTAILIFMIILTKSKFNYNFSLPEKKYIVYILTLLLFWNLWFYLINIQFRQIGQIRHNIDIWENIKAFLDKKPDLKYTTSIFWKKTVPINFIFLAKNDQQVKNVFTQAWFVLADKQTIKTLLKLGNAVYDKYTYLQAPITPLFWNKKVQLFWFQKQGKDLSTRHHIRIRKSNFFYKWYRLYFANAVYDDGYKRWITHKISPNLDKEREYFFSKLFESNLIYKYQKIKILPYTKWKNFSWDDFFTDGMVYVVWL